jgi:hypothetical protein
MACASRTWGRLKVIVRGGRKYCKTLQEGRIRPRWKRSVWKVSRPWRNTVQTASRSQFVDQLFSSSEKRLARLLLLLANFGKEAKPEPTDSENQPGDARGDDWNDPVPRQLLHEQISQTGLYCLQRRHRSPQLIAERRYARSAANQDLNVLLLPT